MRDEMLENLILNQSMIFMGVFEEAFSTLAEKIAAVMQAGGEAMAGAVARGVSESSESHPASPGMLGGGIPPAFRTEIGALFAEIREEVASQWPKNASVFKQYVSGPAFDRGLEIVGRYDFRRPRLTEKLSDEVLASYVFLLQSGDKRLERMFKELADWRGSLPKPPWAR